MLRLSAIKAIALFKFFRFQNHHNFLTVVAGSLFFSSGFSFGIIEDLLAQYLIFGVLLYGGIYTFNGITDANSDRDHPRKRRRPIPSGAISQRGALLWMSLLWTAAFALSYAYDQSFQHWPLYLAFIAVNQFYSLYLRGTNYRYLIGITCPMRLYLGVSLVGAAAPWTAYGIAFCFMCAVQALKIQFENSDSQAWHYSPVFYLLLLSGGLFLIQPSGYSNFLFFSSLAYLVFLFVPFLFPQAGVYLFGADVPAAKKPPLFVAIAIALLRQRDYLGLLSFLLLSALAGLNRLLIALEDVFLPQLSRVSLQNVVFILGHQRSGTTYLHKTLHRHPAITTSSFYDLWFSSLILKVIGQPFKSLLNRLTQYWSTPNHPLSLDEELEEYFWLMLRFKSMVIPTMFPSLMNDFVLTSRCMEYTDEDMVFLKKCLQRVLYYHPSFQVYVGRPLTLTAHPKLLRQHFPDTKLLLCIRNPSNCMFSWSDQTAKVTNRQPSEQLIQNFMQYIYLTYSQHVFENIEKILCYDLEQNQERVHPILFESLKEDTLTSIEAILLFLNLDFTNFSQIVAKKTEHHTNRKENAYINISQKNIDSYRRVQEFCRRLKSNFICL